MTSACGTNRGSQAEKAQHRANAATTDLKDVSGGKTTALEVNE